MKDHSGFAGDDADIGSGGAFTRDVSMKSHGKFLQICYKPEAATDIYAIELDLST
mgnify:CR=1 FL=1